MDTVRITIGVFIALMLALLVVGLYNASNRYEGVADQAICEAEGNPPSFCERLYG